ncbi:MAG: stage III sporulation protein AE [Clostridiales bacterium]|nr:stage III sporulation protein AE [Clostridiales bacterium]
MVICFFIFALFFLKTKIFADEAIENKLDLYNKETNKIDLIINKNFDNDLGIDINLKNLAKKVLMHETNFSEVFVIIKNIFIKEIFNTKHVKNLFAILILSSLVNNLTTSFCSENNIAFYACFIVVSINLISEFRSIILLTQNFLDSLINLIESSVPLIFSLLITNFNKIILSPVIFLTTGTIILIIKIILPCINIFFVMGLLNNIGDRKFLESLVNFIKKTLEYSLKIIAFVFVSVISIERVSSNLFKNFFNKSLRTAIKIVPIVGETFSGTIECILTWSELIKNSFLLGLIILIFFICLVPLIKIILVGLVYRFVAVITQSINDEKIFKSIIIFSDSCILLFSCVFTCVMFFIFSIIIFLTL